MLEGEYFFLCFPKSKQQHSWKEEHTINWHKESAGRQKQIQETQRIVSHMNFLEFWPVELGDSGNYFVTQRWVQSKWMSILPLPLSMNVCLALYCLWYLNKGSVENYINCGVTVSQ